MDGHHYCHKRTLRVSHKTCTYAIGQRLMLKERKRETILRMVFHLSTTCLGQLDGLNLNQLLAKLNWKFTWVSFIQFCTLSHSFYNRSILVSLVVTAYYDHFFNKLLSCLSSQQFCRCATIIWRFLARATTRRKRLCSVFHVLLAIATTKLGETRKQVSASWVCYASCC